MCLQTYDLPEWEPALLTQGAAATPLSATGVQHWRTVLSMLSMLSGSSQSTEMPLPPLCHPPEEPKTNQLTYYSAEDHQRDTKLRSSFFPPKKVILTPLLAPPTPQDVIKKMDAIVTNQQSIVKELQETEPAEGVSDSVGCGVSLSVSTSDAGRDGDPVVIESETKSPAETNLECIVQSDQEQTSFTSYQIPKLERAMDLEPDPSADQKLIHDHTPKRDTSQIEGPTPLNTCGFKISQSSFATSSDTHEVIM